MSRKRRSYEPGHKPKLLLVIDDTDECVRAIHFASRRALRLGVQLVMLRVIELRDKNQQWLNVAEVMRAEAHDEANTILAQAAARANGIAGITPEQVIREGDTAQQILELIDADEDIAQLVLAAGTGNDGPGPLVANLAKNAGEFPIPIAVVPGHLSDEEIDALT